MQFEFIWDSFAVGEGEEEEREGRSLGVRRRDLGFIIWDSSVVGEEEGREREGVWGVRRDLGTRFQGFFFLFVSLIFFKFSSYPT